MRAGAYGVLLEMSGLFFREVVLSGAGDGVEEKIQKLLVFLEDGVPD